MNAIPPGKMAPQAAEQETPAAGIEMQSAPDPELTSAEGQTSSARRDRAAHIPLHLAQLDVTLTVQLGSHHISLKELMEIEPGQLFQLDRMTADPVDILVNGQLFARGEVVAVGERFGVRLTELVGPEEGA